MKQKLLLLLLLISGVLGAQKYDSLIITEARMIAGQYTNVYFEITNMGNTPIDLSEIKFAMMGGGIGIDPKVDTVWDSAFGWDFYLPPSAAKVLEPDESFLMAIAYDFLWTMQKMRVPGYGYSRPINPDIMQYADFLAHREEKDPIELERYPHIKDSSTTGVDSIYWDEQFGNLYTTTIGFCQNPKNGFFLQHTWTPTDSAVIDQVGNMFDGSGGVNTSASWMVAGVTDATSTALLVRKYTIKKGELDFSERGGGTTGLDDSDWLPIKYPEGADNWRDVWWTAGNHGPYVLDENTLTPKAGTDITVDFTGKTITVPWGTRRLDDIMRNMEYTPGVAWVYELNGDVADSLYRSARNGDRLIINVAGNTLYTGTFDIFVVDPLASDNMVIPVDHKSEDPGPVTDNAQNGMLTWPRVTSHGSGDTITGAGYGLPAGLRVDSLFKYLEKAPNAVWEIVFKPDGVERADLRNGDILKVTAEDNSVKEYFLEVQAFEPVYNAFLSSITWPDNDLDEITRFLEGWKGDTIPNFSPSTTGYRIKLPFDQESIPALVARTQDPNATLAVKRATSFDGSVDDRTTVFTVTSEGGDTVQLDYRVEFFRKKDLSSLPPNHALPIVSQFSSKIENNSYLEIANVGNQELDLSRYMFATHANSINPPDAIEQVMNPDFDDWLDRYIKYVPGRKWVDSIGWKGIPGPGFLEEDLNVNTMVEPGDVFLMGEIESDGHVTEAEGYPCDGCWDIPDRLDVQFNNTQSEWVEDTDITPFYHNHWAEWGEPITFRVTPTMNRFNEDQFVFLIVGEGGDSVRAGTKAAYDPNDFELIEFMGVADGRWYPAGIRMTQDFAIHRKPEINRPNAKITAGNIASSFGDDEESSEWLVRDDDYFNDRNIPGSTVINLEADLGQHFFDDQTHYIPTITAILYRASNGYSEEETIEGIVTGTKVSEFLDNIYKADTGQDLSVLSGSTGLELGPDDVISNNDTLFVTAADSSWINQALTMKTLYKTKYAITTSNQGLSSDAELTSTVYTIVTGDTTGTISGMTYETKIQEVLDNVIVPAGATLTVLDEDGLYVSLKRINYGGEYVDALADYNMYFEVVAENTVTTILYQLQPTVPEGEVFVTSDVYDVSQDELLIKFIPTGTNVGSLMSNVLPSFGATLEVIDKTGFQRTDGFIAQDDRLVVTSSDGELAKTYFLALMDEEFIETTIYLAYITSTVYGVDQVGYIISGVDDATSVTDFLSNITPAQGASAEVTDASGTTKASGNIVGDDRVKVTSANGAIIVFYSFDLESGIKPSHFSKVRLYPNPTNAKINIDGLEPESRIEVYNSLGAKVIDVYSMGEWHTISLERESAGLYLIVVSVDNKHVGRYKAIKK